MNNIISDKAKIGNNLNCGAFNIVEDEAVIGDNVVIGNHCVIKSGVVIGDGTVLKDFVELRSGTIIGNDCYIDSRVSSSGNCTVEDNVTLRYDTIVARGTRIGKNSYICPRVMTNNLNKDHNSIGGPNIGENCFVGTNAVLHYGILIGKDSVIGSMSFVNKNCEPNSVYVGIPAKKIK